MNKLLGRTKKKDASAATSAATASEKSEAASSKKTETNGRRLKASASSPKKAIVTNGASDEATGSGTTRVLDNNSMVRTLRQAGSDTTSNAFREDRGLLPSDEEPTLPDYSDSEIIKKKTQVYMPNLS